jgi:hypothetical protein
MRLIERRIRQASQASADWWMSRVTVSDSVEVPKGAIATLHAAIKQYVQENLGVYESFTMLCGYGSEFDLSQCLERSGLTREMFSWPTHAALMAGRDIVLASDDSQKLSEAQSPREVMTSVWPPARTRR